MFEFSVENYLLYLYYNVLWLSNGLDISRPAERQPSRVGCMQCSAALPFLRFMTQESSQCDDLAGAR